MDFRSPHSDYLAPIELFVWRRHYKLRFRLLLLAEKAPDLHQLEWRESIHRGSLERLVVGLLEFVLLE